MKILVVASTFPASDTDAVPAFVKDQIIALKKLRPDLDFSVLAPHDRRSKTQNFSRHEYYDEYRFHYTWPHKIEQLAGRGIMPALKANKLNYLLIPCLFAGEFWALLRLTRRLKPDMIYAHWFTPQAVMAAWVSRLTGRPWVFTTHASDVDVWHKIPIFGKLIVRRNTKKARAFTAVSQRSMAKLERFFKPDDWHKLAQRGAVIPMGIDLPENGSPAAAQASKAFLFIGRLAEKKGLQYLLPAFAEIRQRLPDYRLVIAGDGPMRSQLETLTHDLKLDDYVTFVGYVSGQTKQDLLQTADILVVPSIVTKSGDAEGLPVALMEGLSYGKICIATRESGADEILTDGQDGILIDQQDVNGLSEALIQSAGLTSDEKASMQQQAREAAAQFAWPTIAGKYDDFFFKDRNGS